MEDGEDTEIVNIFGPNKHMESLAALASASTSDHFFPPSSMSKENNEHNVSQNMHRKT